MKKLRKKLFLSIAALAVCSATLVSTTYAWYTSNTEVTASNAIGGTAEAGSSSIFISKDNSKWSSSVEFDDADNQNNSVTMLPVQPILSDGNIIFQDLDKQTAGNSDYMTVTLYVRTAVTDTPTKLYLKSLDIKNIVSATEQLPATDNLNYLGTGPVGGVTNNDATYRVDAVRALNVNIDSTGNNNNVKNQVYDPQGIFTSALLGSDGVNDGDADALTYYNTYASSSVTEGDTVIAPSVLATTGNDEQAVTLGDLPKTGESITITLKVFLNGWDAHCFDACKGQKFTIKVGFTTDVNSALKTQAA